MNNISTPLFDEQNFWLLKNFPVLSGISTNLAGDFSKTQGASNELQQNILLEGLCQTNAFHKLAPQHKDAIAIVGYRERCSRRECDAIVWYKEDDPKISPLLISITADCPTIVLTNTGETKMTAIIHSGWKGTKLNIVSKVIEEISKRINPAEIIAGIYPGICEKCYEVGEDFSEHFPGQVISKHLNLSKIIKEQLYAADVTRINELKYCSFHSKPRDFCFESFRRNRTAKRNAVFIAPHKIS